MEKNNLIGRILPHQPEQISIFLVLGLTYFVTFAGQNIWRSTFHNYAIETFGVSAQQIGYIFSITALPGMLAFGIALIAKRIPIFSLLTFSCSMIGLGLVLIGLAFNGKILLIGSFIVSIGFISFYPVIHSLCILKSDSEKVTITIGNLKSCGPLAAMVAAVSVIVILQVIGYRSFLVVTGTVVICCAMIVNFGIKTKEYVTILGNLRFKTKLWYYYALNFLAGSRSALFKTFVLFLLVNEYNFKVHETTTLLLASNFAGFYGYRLVGRLSNRYDQRNILSAIYAGVALLFLGFCFIKSLLILSILFILDTMLFSASVITDSSLKQRSSPKDIIGDIAFGMTLFYLAGVLTPLAGGLIWKYYGSKGTFLMGTTLAGISILISRAINPTVRAKSPI
jgi:predicted MFS family arabinose efflux permease